MPPSEGARVACLDLAPVAIELARRRAEMSGLSCLAQGELDLVRGSVALHHTLEYAGAAGELLRVLKTGERLVLAETFGTNPLLNPARRWRAIGAREPAEAGEEILSLTKTSRCCGRI